MFNILRSNFKSSPGAACSSSDDDLSLSLSEDLEPATTLLPPELLKKIFLHLSIPELETAREVSHFWHDCANAVLDERYQKQPFRGYKLQGADANGFHLEKVAMANPLLMRLSVIDCEKITSWDFTRTFSQLTNLRGVVLSGEEAYSHAPLKKLGEQNPLMKHLSITDVSGSKENDKGPILAILTAFKTLRSLHLHLPNKTFSDKDLTLFSKYLPTSLRSFTFVSASGLESSHILTIAGKLTSLQKCTLSLNPSVKSNCIKKTFPKACEFVEAKTAKIKN